MTRRKKLGFLGAGNMARALIKGVLGAELYRPSELWVTDALADARRMARRRFGVGAARDNRELVRDSEIVLLAGKPQIMPEILDEVREAVDSRQLFISLAAGVPLRRLEEGPGAEARVVRAMTTTPA